MSVTTDPCRLFSEKHGRYVRFIRGVGYPQGLRAHFASSSLLRSDLRVLDAGCGTGVATLSLREALLRRSFSPGPMHAFDLTPAMIQRFRRTLEVRGIEGIDVVQADVLRLGALPQAWVDHDLIVSASMMEYLPRNEFSVALSGLRTLLKRGGTLVLFVTRRNWLTRPLIGRWWQSNLYQAGELQGAFKEAGFSTVAFRRFPVLFRYLDAWGYIVEASAGV